MNGDEWITTQEAAELSGYHVNYLRKLIRRGDIRGRKISFLWFVNRQSLLDYMAQAGQSDDKRRGPKP
jgi:excisionase family DNA binding protein